MASWPLDGVLAASHEDSNEDSLYGIPLGISVVGGENAIQRQADDGILLFIFTAPTFQPDN